MSAARLEIDADALRPLIDQAVAAALAALEKDRGALDGKLAYSEPEAARLLSLHAHQLRDERLRGRIHASVGPGKKILYGRDDLMDYLRSRRWEKSD